MKMPRYNKICRLDGCNRWRREDDVVCRVHYYQLPQRYRRLLWGEPYQVRLALNVLDGMERFGENT